MTRRVRYGLTAALAWLAGCTAGTSPYSAPASAVASPQAQEELRQVRQAYDAGRYGDVIRRVARSDALAAAPDDLRIEAFKLQAFSYCVNDYAQLCQDAFGRILQIRPDFTLAPSEAGHPQWGPVFERAKVASGG